MKEKTLIEEASYPLGLAYNSYHLGYVRVMTL